MTPRSPSPPPPSSFPPPPGWSHFAQFTIAVVNKDPKKSKYSDTLHRFCKKEHDWGWKKFMELSKVLDGFTVADTLVIKAQVQVIHEKPARPFRCLEPQYRRELVRVYLTNVEGICRRFLEEKRETLAKLRDDADKWEAMREFLTSDLGKTQAALATEKADALLKAIVKRFFNEKEVTSTLVMDALYCGCRALDVGAAPGALDHAAKNVKPGRSILLSIAQNKVREWRTRSEPGRRASPSREHRSRQSCALLAVRVIAFFVLSVDISVPTREDKRFTPLIRRANESTPDETSGFSPVQPSPPFPPRRVRARG